jgi:hypothetical protein
MPQKVWIPLPLLVKKPLSTPTIIDINPKPEPPVVTILDSKLGSFVR